jgi:hypothetical protein
VVPGLIPLNARVHAGKTRDAHHAVSGVAMSKSRKPNPQINRNMKTPARSLLLTAAAIAAPSVALAQPTAHYVPGVEGIKAASLPPPGVYVRDYNVFYFSHQLNDASGHGIDAAGADAFIYANVPRVIWITEQKLLGGYLGVDALLPLQYTDLQANTPFGRFSDSTFGIGDFFAEGTWSWHVEHFDVSVAYGVWAPTGDSAAPLSTRAGSGFWTQMITAGATWYPDKAKQFSVSALSRYEFNTIDGDTGTRPGQAYTLEWGVGYAPCKVAEFGVVGYFQQQTTQDSPAGILSSKDHVVAVGPEISAVCPKLGLITSLRYLYEVSAADRLQGQTVTLTFTKRF